MKPITKIIIIAIIVAIIIWALVVFKKPKNGTSVQQGSNASTPLNTVPELENFTLDPETEDGQIIQENFSIDKNVNNFKKGDELVSLENGLPIMATNPKDSYVANQLDIFGSFESKDNEKIYIKENNIIYSISLATSNGNIGKLIK